MASGERILESIEEEMAGHGTPQAITITIVEPSAWRPEPAGLHTTTYDSTALVTSVQAQDAVGQDTSTLVVVPGEGGGHRRRINVSHGAKGSIQTVSADGHITTQELPIISSVCSNEDETSQHSTIQVSNKIEPSDTHGILSVEGEVIEESEEIDDSEDTIGHHCLVCNVELPIHANDEAVPLFKTDTTATQRKMAVYLGILVGRKLTSGRVHSDTICRRCFSLLDRVDSLEVEIKETKEEIVNKYLDTQAAYGGRAQRRKTVAPKQSDYVYPKVVEPEDEVDEVLKLEMDDNFEPSMDDLIEEEQDQQEDHNTQDEEWEPEFRRPRVKREAPDLDPSGQPKRKRGRPRKDASRPKSRCTTITSCEQSTSSEQFPQSTTPINHSLVSGGSTPLKYPYKKRKYWAALSYDASDPFVFGKHSHQHNIKLAKAKVDIASTASDSSKSICSANNAESRLKKVWNILIPERIRKLLCKEPYLNFVKPNKLRLSCKVFNTGCNRYKTFQCDVGSVDTALENVQKFVDSKECVDWLISSASKPKSKTNPSSLYVNDPEIRKLMHSDPIVVFASKVKALLLQCNLKTGALRTKSFPCSDKGKHDFKTIAQIQNFIDSSEFRSWISDYDKWEWVTDVRAGTEMRRYIDRIPFDTTRGYKKDKLIDVTYDEDTMAVSVVESPNWGKSHRTDEIYSCMGEYSVRSVPANTPVVTMYIKCSSLTEECLTDCGVRCKDVNVFDDKCSGCDFSLISLKSCSNCKQNNSQRWHRIHGKTFCKICYNYYLKKKRHRPRHLWKQTASVHNNHLKCKWQLKCVVESQCLRTWKIYRSRQNSLFHQGEPKLSRKRPTLTQRDEWDKQRYIYKVTPKSIRRAYKDPSSKLGAQSNEIYSLQQIKDRCILIDKHIMQKGLRDADVDDTKKKKKKVRKKITKKKGRYIFNALRSIESSSDCSETSEPVENDVEVITSVHSVEPHINLAEQGNLVLCL